MENSTFLKLKEQLNYLFKRSLFYQKKLYNFSRDKILMDFSSVPFTTKKEILVDQEKEPPFGSNLCISIEEIQRIHKTSGTTNKPVIVALTKEDIESTIKIGSSCFKNSGLKRTDLVVHCLNYNMWAGGYTDHQSLEETGAGVIPFGVGNSRSLIETILMLKPTAIHCTPSYLSILENIVRTDYNISPGELSLKIGLFGGESGLQDSAFRSYIENTWELKAMNANYGLSEVMSIIASECSMQNGLHYLASEYIFPEIVDMSTGRSLPIVRGNVGELVLSNLYKFSQPLIRYRTGDIVKITSTNCECGKEGFLFNVEGRVDDMIVVKGINVFISSIAELINRNLEEITDNFVVMASRKDPIDRLVLRVEIRNHIPNSSKKYVMAKLMTEFQKDLNIKPEIDLLNENELPKSEGKSKRLLRVL